MKQSSKETTKQMFSSAVYVIVAFAMVGFTVYACWGEWLSLCLNLLTIFVMVCLSAKGIGIFTRKNRGSIYALQSDTSTIEKASQYLQNRKKESLTIEQIDAELQKYFQTRATLNEVFQSYRQEKMLTSGSGAHNTCDIADFFNEGLLDDCAGSAYSESVGGTMTAIGILGTFVGLMLSLKSFDGGTQDILMSMIPLISGMKVAFLTSIYGIVASVLYNFLYRDSRSNADVTLEQFLQVYYQCVSRRPENETAAMLLDYQQQQIQMLEHLKDTIAAAIAEQISISVPEMFNAAVTPRLEALTQNLIDGQEKLAAEQETKVQQIAEKMIDRMNVTLKGRFTELSHLMQDFCQDQKTTRAQMLDISNQLTTSGNQLSETHAKLDESLKAFQSYATTLSQAQSSLNEEFMATLKNYKQLTTQSVALNRTLDVLATRVDSMLANADSINAAALNKLDEMTKSADAHQTAFVTEISTQNERYQKIQQALENGILTQAQQLNAMASTQEKMLTESLEKISEYTKETETSFSVTSAKLDEVSDKYKELTQVLIQNLQEANNIEDKLKQDAANIWKVSGQVSISTTQTVAKIQTQFGQLDQQFEQIDSKVCSLVGALQTALDSIHHTLSSLDNNLNRAAGLLNEMKD